MGNDDKHVPNEVKSYGVKGDNKIKSNCKKLMMASFQNDKKKLKSLVITSSKRYEQTMDFQEKI